MAQLLPQDLLHHLEWRYAVKAFDPTRKIPAPVWDALETALQLTPSSYGLQPWKAPEPLPPIDEADVQLVVWMAVDAVGERHSGQER